MKSPSKIFFYSLQQQFLNLFHHLYTDPRLETPLKNDRLAQDRVMSQTSAENGQSLPKCGIVSYDKLQSQQIGLQGHPRFCRLFAVRILLCNMVHAKKRHFGSMLAFPIGENLILQKFIMNWILYALLEL
jgi:hypothetical protein